MSGPGAPWLTEDEMAAWLPLVRLLATLPAALDRQLREEAGLTHVWYQVLAMLSASPQGERMSELARLSGTSLSRLSHAVSAMEAKGWVERCPAPEDRRGQRARLTAAGDALLAGAAPGHAAEVRRRVFDRLDAAQTRQLRALATLLLDGQD